MPVDTRSHGRPDRRRDRVRPFPMERLPQVELLRALSRRPAFSGLFEADVTAARRSVRGDGNHGGRRLSFTAFLVHCLARAVDENREVQAFRKGRRRLVVFDEVDVATLIEVEAQGRRVPLVHVVRDAARKTVAQIHDEIRAAQAGTGLAPLRRRIGRARVIPRPLRALLWRMLPRAPHTWKRYGGTVVLTSVGMFGRGAGWGLSAPGGYPLSLIVGGIGERPGIVDGRIEPREFLSLTVSFDHEILDGAPAARFAARLRELVERGIPAPCLARTAGW